MNTANVLVVDDEIEIRDTVADNFRKRGCNVLTASNGADALRMVAEQKINAVVTDVRMPRMTGLELLDQLKSLPGESPAVILMSGYADVTSDEVYHRGAEALFHKPFSIRLLVDATLGQLLPREELWGTQPEDRASMLQIQQKYPSLEAATTQLRLRLGRGGMFMALGDYQLRKDGLVSFHFDFEGGGIPTLAGNGVVRWVRRAVTDGMPAGCGVEFTYLADSSRSLFARMTTGTRARPFIPKS